MSSDDFNLEVDFKGLKGRAKEFHVHFLPIAMASVVDTLSSGDSAKCSAVDGHYYYDKDEADQTLMPGASIWPGELEKDYKFDFEGENDVKKVLEPRPPQLDGIRFFSGRRLSGPHSMIGRSIVIHGVHGDRLACATILEEGAEYEKTQQKFTGDVEGTIEVMRKLPPGDGKPRGGEVTMFIDLELTNGETDEYKWCVDAPFPCDQNMKSCRKVVTLDAGALVVSKVDSGSLKVIRADQPCGA